MEKIGLFYGTQTDKTAAIAQKIKEAFGSDQLDIVPVEKAWSEEFESYRSIIAGASTWFDGELPTYWDELVPQLSSLDLSQTKIAIFGLGDQINYPDNFVDGIGILADIFEKAGATLVGFTSPEGYRFNRSLALKDGHFLGLAIDIENQNDQTDRRIRDWVEQLKKEFGLPHS